MLLDLSPNLDPSRIRTLTPWRPSVPQDAWDAREVTRLELVGLASEVVTQAARIQEELRATGAGETHEVALRAREVAVRSWAVLEPYATVHHFSHAVLKLVLLDLHKDQREILQLREQADHVAKGHHRAERPLWKSLGNGLSIL
jgi:hypothetical protein